MAAEETTDGWVVETVDGARIGLISCDKCGALVPLAVDSPGAARHIRWHEDRPDL